MYVILAILLVIAVNIVIGIIKAALRSGYNKFTEPVDALKKTEREAERVIEHYGMSHDDALRYKNMQRFGTCFARYALLVAMADSEFDPREVSAIFGFFKGAEPNYLKGIQDSLKKDLNNPGAIDWEHGNQVARELFSDPNLLGYDSVLFDGLLNIAASDGNIAKEELKAIIGIMAVLGWSSEQIQSHIHSRFSVGEELSVEEKRARAYQALGLCNGCTPDDVKKAYRTLAKQYHPDMVRHMGQKVQKTAAERFHEIRDAYEYLSQAL